MGFYNVINAPSMQSGQPEDVSQVLANFNAIASVLNGNVDNSNIATAAAIALTKLTPGSAGRILGMDQTPTASWLPGVQQIGDTTLSTTGQMALASIPQTFSNLLIVARFRSAIAQTSSTPAFRFNGDAGNNYDWSRMGADNATFAADSSFGAATSAIVTAPCPAASAGSGNYNGQIAIIPGYSTAGVSHVMFGLGWTDVGTMYHRLFGGFWNGTAGINNLWAFSYDANSNFLSGSRMTIYGFG